MSYVTFVNELQIEKLAQRAVAVSEPSDERTTQITIGGNSSASGAVPGIGCSLLT